MRVFATCFALALCAACGHPTAPAGSSSPATASDAVNPANITRLRTELPEGYEVADLAGRASPLAFWGFGPHWSADPPQCGALADLPSDRPAQGWSASGPGGIVYAAVVDSAGGLDATLVIECGVWTVSAGHTSGLVTSVTAPVIEGAATVGMVTDATTVVEGGTETHSRAATFSAYLSGHVAYVTIVTDPGSPDPALGPDFAAALLTKAVSAMRGG